MRAVTHRGSSLPSCRTGPGPHGTWRAMPASVPQPTGAPDTACRQRRPASPRRCVGCAPYSRVRRQPHGLKDCHTLDIQAGTFASLVGVSSAAYVTDNRRALVAALLGAVGIGVFYATTRMSFDGFEIVGIGGLWLAGWMAGSVFRIRRSHAAAVERRAEVLEQDSEARAREAVADERARITRELHDIIGHTLNLIVVQAGAARAVFKSRPDQALESLDSIEITARQSLSDIERMLGILRPREAEAAPYDPQPGLEQVDRLAEQFTDVGLPVEVNVEGEPHKLPTSLDLSAYRIVQEALH